MTDSAPINDSDDLQQGMRFVSHGETLVSFFAVLGLVVARNEMAPSSSSLPCRSDRAGGLEVASEKGAAAQAIQNGAASL